MQCDAAISGTPAQADLLPRLATGDLVLFSGQGWASDIIRWFCGSPWTHVGMVIRLEEAAEPLIIESLVSAEARDCITGACRSGVIMTFARERITTYRGSVAIRRLEQPLPGRVRDLLKSQARQWCHLPYRQYLAAQLRRWLFRCEQGSGMFCSELVAALYHAVGRLPPQCSPVSALPMHFALDDALAQALALGELVMIKGHHVAVSGQETSTIQCCEAHPDSAVVSADQLRYV